MIRNRRVGGCGWSRLLRAVSFTTAWDLCWRGRWGEEEDESVIISGFRVHGYLRPDQVRRGCWRGVQGMAWRGTCGSDVVLSGNIIVIFVICFPVSGFDMNGTSLSGRGC